MIVSRGPLSHQQVDSRSSRMEIWLVVVVEVFNVAEVFSVPAVCANVEIDPNLHPVGRTVILCMQSGQRYVHISIDFWGPLECCRERCIERICASPPPKHMSDVSASIMMRVSLFVCRLPQVSGAFKSATPAQARTTPTCGQTSRKATRCWTTYTCC